jgi:hypothetical protein
LSLCSKNSSLTPAVSNIDLKEIVLVLKEPGVFWPANRGVDDRDNTELPPGAKDPTLPLAEDRGLLGTLGGRGGGLCSATFGGKAGGARSPDPIKGPKFWYISCGCGLVITLLTSGVEFTGFGSLESIS